MAVRSRRAYLTALSSVENIDDRGSVFLVCRHVHTKVCNAAACKGAFKTPKSFASLFSAAKCENTAELNCLYVCAHISGLVDLN